MTLFRITNNKARRRPIAVAVALATALLASWSLCAPKARADEDPVLAHRNDRAAYLVHLMDQQRYAEAAQGVQQLFIDYPADPASYEVRGVLLLHVGAYQQAEHDFQIARATAATTDALPDYGLAVCAMFEKDYDKATRMLASADQILNPNLPDDTFAKGRPTSATVAPPTAVQPATPAAPADTLANMTPHDDITIAKAMILAANGDYVEAVRLASTVDTPTGQEIVALSAYENTPNSGLSLVEKFVEDGAVNDVPRVNEDSGLRFVGVGEKSSAIIEPSLTESVLQAMFAQRLAYANAPAATGTDNAVMSSITLTPPANVVALTGQSDLVVTVYVDDHLLGMVNATPFELQWDTKTASNGTHVVKFEVSDLHGAVLQTLYRKVNVTNPGADTQRTTNPLPADIAASLWNMLRIHPAYKAAEYTLASAYFERKDKQRAATHLLIAAALDAEYHGVGDQIAQVLGNGPSSKPVKLASASLNEPIHTDSAAPAYEMWSGSTKLHEVALTFDDGPSPILTPPLLDNLEKAGIPGTFFVVGMRATLVPDILHRMRDAGDEVENHTYTHPNLDQAIPQHIEEEYLRDGVVIRSLTGRWPRFLRPPGGNTNPQVMDLARKCGMIGGFWTLDALHAEDSGSAKNVADYVLSKIHPGAIVLMHNGAEATTAAIPAIVAGLKAKGLKCVTLAQLARDSGIALP